MNTNRNNIKVETKRSTYALLLGFHLCLSAFIGG